MSLVGDLRDNEGRWWFSSGWFLLIAVLVFMQLSLFPVERGVGSFWQSLFGHPNGLASYYFGQGLLGLGAALLPFAVGIDRIKGWFGKSGPQPGPRSLAGTALPLVFSSLWIFVLYQIVQPTGLFESTPLHRLALGLALPLGFMGLVGRDLVAGLLDRLRVWRTAAAARDRIYRDLRGRPGSQVLPPVRAGRFKREWRVSGAFLGGMEPGHRFVVGVSPRVGFKGAGVVLTIDSQGAIPAELEVRSEPLFSFKEDYQAGEVGFDKSVRLEGGEATLAALLTLPVCRQIQQFLDLGSFALRDGRIEAVFPAGSGGELASELTEKCLELANSLVLGADERPARLLEVTRTHSWVGAVYQALSALVENYPGHLATTTAVEERMGWDFAQAAARARVVVLAAEASDQPDFGILLRLVGDPEVDEDSVGRALDLAGRHLEEGGTSFWARDTLLTGLRRGSADEDEPAMRRALEWLLISEPPEQLAELLLGHTAQLESIPSEASRDAYVEAWEQLVTAGATGVEAELRALLDPAAAASACTRIGACLVIEALGALGEEESLGGILRWKAAQPELGRWSEQVVEQSLAKIRRRTGNYEQGSLSIVAEPEQAGGLSRVAEEGGLAYAGEDEPAAPKEAVPPRTDKQPT